MPDTKLFKRKYVITVGTVQTEDLACKFTVKKSLKPEPNTCDLTIFNLSPDNRQALEQAQAAIVKIEAGYEEGTSVIFLGDLRTAESGVREGPNWITALSSGDGEKKHRTARVKISVARNTTTDQALRQLVTALGIPQGNLNQAINTIKASGLANLFSEGTVIMGSASREMTAICRSLGLLWSVQNGKLQILGLRQALDGEAIKVSQETGMVGSPTVDNKGILKVRMLMIPDVFPGRKLVLDSERLKGQYRIETSTHTGDTHGSDWYCDVEAKRY